ncbi:glucose-1-phosphate cytidylyltransferase [Megamonas hypermegale]|uniref:glucose-1-phosphate cytidylyltransferase n=1 Tax=Megamonas hypermegale TaxID=158847 RepID=UPI001958BE1B|nr:glucose-1-phosphate cytidylyltransferase [Megamonas hypermegale]MBM6761412.1 glucose-1-phosphate cytidylyltransferase [Megamonas hypermegale]
MKVVLLAGGLGTRISEESQYKPKPMIEIGGKPILWHIMKEYSNYGYNEFIICAGYKQHLIKNYFANYYLQGSDITFDFSNGNTLKIHNNNVEPWKVTIVDTGLNTMTGGRIKRIKDYVNNETFMLTYGDGVCDVNINELEKFHRSHGKICTLTAVKPEGRFGILDLVDNNVMSFREKNKQDVGYINGGYMVLEPEIFEYIDNDNTTFEKEPLEKIADNGQLMAYKHNGFWQCMDTLRDKIKLEKLWDENKAPWKVW